MHILRGGTGLIFLINFSVNSLCCIFILNSVKNYIRKKQNNLSPNCCCQAMETMANFGFMALCKIRVILKLLVQVE